LEGLGVLVIKINTDSGVDTLLEILRQSQIIRTNKQNNENNKALDTKEIDDNVSYNPRAYLKSPDTDKDIFMSRKGHHNSQRKKDEAYHKKKSQLEGILNRMTAQDYKKLSEEGFKPEDLTIDALTFAVQLIKDYTGNAGNKEKVLNKKNDQEKDSDKDLEDRIKKRMEDENLPISKDYIERIKRALKLSEDIPNLEKKDIRYLLNKELTPSIENLYKARYSNKSNEHLVKLTEDEWQELIPQVSQIVGDTKAIVDNEYLEDARWLIENNIPLTKENISLLIGIKDLTKNYSTDVVLDRIFKGMKEGALPGEASLIEGDELDIDSILPKDINIKQLIEDIEKITEKDIIETVQTKDKQAKILTAKRQLEEIRLKMTIEAAIRLDKKGFHIETETLERIVERLRIEEEIYYEELYKQGIIESEESSLGLLQLTSESIYELKRMPAYVLGRTLINRESQTVPDLLQAGKSVSTELDNAREAYEALFTIPRAEYGDSIKKAFSNMSSLMEELGVEDTEYNQRAIRILGYNRMDITHESIEQVKAYDLSVNYLLQNLNPGIAVQIIKDGVNPLNVPIDELNDRIERLKEQGYSSLDKYSSYLYKLEREEGISETERKAYIGIYRLLYQVEKSDGAALGAIIKADQSVTLNHLLTALRTNKKGKMDYSVDDGFGELHEVSFKKESITDQLGAIFNDNYQEDIDNATIQNEIQNAIIKELLNSLTPEKLQQLHASIQNMAANSKEESATQPNVWETLGNIPTEQLLEQVKNIQTNPGENQAYYYEKLKELQEVYSNSDQSIRFLNDLKLPCTTTNLMMAGQILNNSTMVFKRLFGFTQDKEEDKEEKSQYSLKKKLKLSDTLIDNETMTEAYEQLEQEVKAVIDQEVIKENIDLDKLTQLRNMGMQMHFIKNLAHREYYHIPIEASGKITNINLTIIRGKSSCGKVTVSLVSESLGSIRAEASLKESKLSGYIACDYAEGLKLLEAQTEPLKLVAQEEGFTIKQMNFCLQQASDAIYTHQNAWDAEEDKNPETEKILYRIAKAMIHMIRSAEDLDSAVA
jgi:hypothetical protein